MLPNKEGQKVPQVTFKTRQNNQWVDVTTDQIFTGKNVVVFALPGAFTPTCSSTHVPGYNELAPAFYENGIDDIICLSVNDTFVMNEWAIAEKADKVKFIPDGNGEFTEKMGMLVNKDDLGFGKRSWRYSMLVKDGTIEKMFIEPEKEGDPFEVSDADTMLQYINPHAKKPLIVTLFTRVGCPFCTKAKEALKERGIEYDEIILWDMVTPRALHAVTGKQTVPQVFINGSLIGGSDELIEYLKTHH